MGSPAGRVLPVAEKAQNPLHHPRVINHGDDPHRVLADRAAQRVNIPDPQNQVALPLGGKFQGRWGGDVRTAGWACGAGRFST